MARRRSSPLIANEVNLLRTAFKKAMRDKNYDQIALAEKTGINRSTINRILSGERELLFDYAVAIAKVLEIRFSVAPNGNNTCCLHVDGGQEDANHSRVRLERADSFATTAHMLPTWSPILHSAREYLELVFPFFQADGDELIYSEDPVTRLLLPRVQAICLHGRVSKTVSATYCQICTGMNDLWQDVRQSRKKRARICNILTIERFDALVKTDPETLPPNLGAEWPKLRVAWLEDLERQIDQGRCTPLFIDEATLQKTKMNHPDIKEKIDVYGTIALVNGSHLIKKQSSNNEITVASNEDYIEEYVAILKTLEKLARKEAASKNKSPEEHALDLIRNHIKWGKVQPNAG